MGVVGLARAAGIDSLEVNGAPRVTICLCSDHHPALPIHRSIHRNSFQHPKPHISVQTIQDRLLPVERYDTRGVHGSRACSRINMEFKWGAALKEGQGLVFTNIECGSSVSVQQIPPELRKIFLCGRAGHRGWSSWWQLPPRT